MLLDTCLSYHKLKVKKKGLGPILRNDWLYFAKALAKLLIP